MSIIDEELTYVLSLAVPHGSLALAVLISYCIASGRDPGKLRTDPNLEFMELLQKFSPTDLCPDCEVIRTRRSRHCAICNVCIERYDHHCPWINNCVGVRNHNSFIAFLASTWLFILFSIGAVITSNHIRSFSNFVGLSIHFNSIGDADHSDEPLYPLCLLDMCNTKGIWYATLGLLLATATLFIFPVR